MISNIRTFQLCQSLLFCTLLCSLVSCSSDSTGNSKQPDSQIEQSPVAVKLEKNENGDWQLLRDNKPYYINGAGGEGSFELLAACGGNSGRLWGVDGNTMARLDEAHKNGITIALGIWLEHSQKGFDYENEELVKKQFDTVMKAVRKYKDHPAVLLWGIGNEMEGYDTGDNPGVWKHVEALAKQIKLEDPNHPTMSVVAEIPATKVAAIHKYAPSLDIVGVNSYGGAPSLGKRYRDAGGTKPYIVSEFGPVGTWEVPKNSIDAIEEPTSTAKVNMYQNAYESIKGDTELCLGSYAFLWGNKQEGTATWFGMLLPNGSKTSAVDFLTKQWSGKEAENLCPMISEIKLDGPNKVEPDSTVSVSLTAKDPEGAKLNATWTLMQEASDYVTGGDFQETPPVFPNKIVSSDATGAKIKMPIEAGLYRIYVEVDDGNRAAATANVVVRVKGPEISAGPVVDLPYVVYDENGQENDFVPSGWMGNTGALNIKLDSTDQPKSGKICIQCEYSAPGNWGGVVWQNPENDWGDLDGGKNFTGAKKMTFWARGNPGGEKVKFGFGLLGHEKKFFDTTKKEEVFTLTKAWKQYSFDLSKDDLKRIKTPLFWTVEGNGQPLKFYLDKIVVE